METIRTIVRYFINNPGSEFRYYLPILILIAAMIIFAIVLGRIVKAKKANNPVFKKHFEKTPSKFVYFGLVFLFLLLARYEEIPLFSWRIWFLVAGIGFAIYLFFLIRKAVKVYPKELNKYESRPKKTVKKKKKYTTKK